MKKVTRFVDLAPGDPTNDSFVRVTTDEWTAGYSPKDKRVWGDVYITASDNYRVVKLDLEASTPKEKARNLKVLRLLAKHILEAADRLEKMPVGPVPMPTEPIVPTRVKPRMKKKAKKG